MNFFKFSCVKLFALIVLEIILYVIYRLFQPSCGIPEPGQNPYTYCMSSTQYFLIFLMILLIIYLIISLIYSKIKK